MGRGKKVRPCFSFDHGTWALPVLTLGHCGGGLGSDHFLNQKDCAGGKRHNLGRLQTSQLPRVDGVCPPPREAVGTPGSYSPTWLGRADSQPSLSLQGDGSQGAWFHLYLISFCAGNLMDSLALRDEVPAGPG